MPHLPELRVEQVRLRRERRGQEPAFSAAGSLFWLSWAFCPFQLF